MHFQLPAGCNSEAQLAFCVTDVTFPHKVRGTVTYMMQVRSWNCMKLYCVWLRMRISYHIFIVHST